MTGHEKIFVIDDEVHVCDTIEEALTQEGFRVSRFDNPILALKAASEHRPDLVVTDLVMPGLEGLEVIKRLKTLDPEINVVVITGHASLDSAIGAIRSGASDYLVKPFKIGELLESVRKALSQKRLIPKLGGYDRSFERRYQIKNLIGNTAEMKEIFKLIEKVAKGDSTVLIMGESGTGKEVVARAIHYCSKRRKGPFVSINCAALPENLLESELFGYEKGAFTGAQGSKMGLLELAAGGTFVLDEVGDMSLQLQAKILRVLQERILKRVGGIKDISCDFRLIAATSKNMPDAIRKGEFREDLFYRLNVIPMVLPTLRHRREDVPVFVYYFLGLFAEKQGVGRRFKVTQEAMEVFTHYDWPGNVRELENMMERLVALTDKDEIDRETAQKVLQQSEVSSSLKAQPIKETGDLRQSVEAYERELIEKAIEEAHGNKNKAARKLNLTRQALQYKISKYRIAS